MTAASHGHRAAGVAGARFGVLFGCSCWIVVLGAIAAAHGRWDVLLPVVLPLLLASLGLGLLVLAVFEPLMALPMTHQQRLRFPLVFGGVQVLCGVMLLLAEAFVVPVLRHDPALGDAVRGAGGVLELPRWMSAVMLVSGCAVLVIGLRRAAALRQESIESPAPR